MAKVFKDTIDLVFSFDTTGSMYPCLTQVRRVVGEMVETLFDQIPNLRIGVITHGDYCDGDEVITLLDLTDNRDAICRFIRVAPSTGGGDIPECYELVLHRARSLSWTSGKSKALVLIGDANPHSVGYRWGSHRNELDWKNELKLLVEAGISVIPVQALGRCEANFFYSAVGRLSGHDKLELEQFKDIENIIKAICSNQAGQLPAFEKAMESCGGVSYSVWKAIDVLSGRKPRVRPSSVSTLKKGTGKAFHPVHPSRFQVLIVEKDCDIRGFVTANGLIFKKGHGFYEFTKSVKVQDYKEVIVQDRATGEMFTGDEARELLGIPVGASAQVKPDKLCTYLGFIQSTSVNRKLLAGTSFLYEVDDWGG